MQNKTDGYVIFKNGQRGLLPYGGKEVSDAMFFENDEIIAVSLPNSVERIGNASLMNNEYC